MTFECLQCGECCSYLGQVHTLVREISNTEFLVRNEYTNETKVVTLDPDKTDWYKDKSIFQKWSEACPFLRQDPNMPERICCSVHLTRPDMCKSYGCWRALILDKDGNIAGRIMGAHFLRCGNEDLQKFWDEKIRAIKFNSYAEWDNEAFALLKNAGYTISYKLPPDVKKALDIACGIYEEESEGKD